MIMKCFYISGTVILTIANLLGKFFGAIYRIPLSNLLGASGIGLYQMTFPIYSFFLTLLTGGISVTLSRNISKLRAKGDIISIGKQYKLALNSSIVFGVFITIILLLFAYPFSVLQGNSDAYLGYYGISVGFVFASILGVYRGYWQGHNTMIPTAISQIIEQLSKLFFGLLFSYILSKNSLMLGVCGALLGISFSEILTFLYFKIKNKNIIQKNIATKKGEYKEFIKDCIPVSISYGMLPLSAFFDTFVVINVLVSVGFTKTWATSIYGIETGMILPLINIPNVLISALAISIVPKLSYKIANNKNIKQDIVNIFKIVIIFLIPSMVGIYFLSGSIISVLYPNLNAQYTLFAINLLKISVFEMFFLCFVGISNAILQSIGKTKVPAISMLIGVIIKLLLEIFLIRITQINIFGQVIASFVGYFVISSINIYQIKKITQFNMKIKTLLFPIISATIMGIVLYFIINSLKIWANLLIICFSVFVSVILYFLLLLAFGEIKLNIFNKNVAK